MESILKNDGEASHQQMNFSLKHTKFLGIIWKKKLFH